MDALLGYGSDADCDDDAGAGSTAPAQPPPQQKPSLLSSLPAAKGGGGGGGGMGLPPPAKKQRVLQLPVKKLAAGDSDDDDEPAMAMKPKSSGLLSFLPAPKQAEASSTAYEEALSRKSEAIEAPTKMSKAAMTAKLFEKQKQDKLAAAAAAAAQEEEGGVGEAGGGGDAGGGGHAGGGSDQAPAEVDPNWAAAWDEANQAYYYYHTITGLTQWDPPIGFDTSSLEQQQEQQLPDELQRELDKETRRAQKRGEFVPQLAREAVLGGAKVASAQQMLEEGERHVEHRSMAAAYHTPMQAAKKVGTIEKRKHQITDVLAHAAKHELDFLEHSSNGRAAQAKVRNRYGW